MPPLSPVTVSSFTAAPSCRLRSMASILNKEEQVKHAEILLFGENGEIRDGC
jgi:hypothetical protein